VNEGVYLVSLAANLFGYAGEQGDLNSLYTYAQLLRTGTATSQRELSAVLSAFPQAKECRQIHKRQRISSAIYH
jgi:hypothetical protein